MLCAYHLVPPEMHGQVIYPLNMLADLHPDLHRDAVRKYICRDRLQGQRIPPLNCLWGDVVFLTAIHPTAQRNAFRRAELPPSLTPTSFRCFKIDLSTLDLRQLAVMIWDGYDKRFERFDPDRFDEYAQVPEAALDYYRACREQGDRPLRFNYMPHVLYRGSIDISRASLVDAA